MISIRVVKWGRGEFFSLLANYKVRIGAEIGVYNGELSHLLIQIPNIERLYLVDPYKEYKDVSIHDSQKTHDLRYEMVCEKFKNEPVKVLRKTSREAINLIPDNSLDFVYIDADHSSEEVKWDVSNWYKKVKNGGVVAGHDFSFLTYQVARSIMEFVESLGGGILTLCEGDSTWFLIKEIENE